MSKTRELIYYGKELKKGDRENFSGELSPVSFEKRKEYLRRYADFLKSEYGVGGLPQKVVSEAEAQELAAKYGSKEDFGRSFTAIDTAQAYIKPAKSGYKGWFLYTYGAKIEDGRICFTDNNVPPVPSAKYELSVSGKVKEAEFEFCVDRLGEKYARGTVTASSGRIFDFRHGCKTVAKLQMYPNGDFGWLDGSELHTHPKIKKLCSVEAGKTYRVRVVFGDKTATVTVGGETVGENLNLYCNEDIDNVFFGGGMLPLGNWQAKLNKIVADKEYTDFFVKDSSTAKETLLGEKELPFAIGTEKYKDNILIFRKSIEYSGKGKTVLHIGAIDPCGEVFINGKSVIRTESFLRIEKDITGFLKKGENTLEVHVMPRAPEVFYQWHRHADPYNGWQLRGVYLEHFDCVRADGIQITTDRIDGKDISFTVSSNLYGKGKAEVYIQKIFPEKGKEELLDSFEYGEEASTNDRNATQYKRILDPWDTDKPNLYQVILRLKGESGEEYERKAETGFRIIEQRGGEVLLNGKRIKLNGALSMQFLPPHEQTPINHVCPSNAQIAAAYEQIRRMNGNSMRLHFLGYGTNDPRFARIADRMGCTIVWTTRLIDTVENYIISGKWNAKEEFIGQMKEVINYPSIIMWEGSNEAIFTLEKLDSVYDDFVSTVKSADKTRLICPSSHHFYGGGIYSSDICEYYNDDGTTDAFGNPKNSSFGWKDKNVVRSAHTYDILLGYGKDWEMLVKQNWKTQDGFLRSKDHAYLITEFAIIGRACPYVPEAKEYFNPNSYELGNEEASLGGYLSDEEFELSQAHQALCALYAVKKMNILGADGMYWCCLQSGANDGSYLKPIIDFYGYAKLAFYMLRDVYEKSYCVLDCDGPIWNGSSKIRPVLITHESGEYEVTVTVKDENGKTVLEKRAVQKANDTTRLDEIEFAFEKSGYYSIVTETKKLK